MSPRAGPERDADLPCRPVLSLAAAIYFVGADLLLTGGRESVQLDHLSYELVLKMDGTRTVDDLALACEPLTGAPAPELRRRIVELVDLLHDHGYVSGES